MGNLLAKLYGIRVVAIITNSTFSFHCKGQAGTLLKPFEVDLARPEQKSRLLSNGKRISTSRTLAACNHPFPHSITGCLELASEIIIHDLQQIARQHSKTIERDDAVIHLRCGDILGLNASGYGLVPHAYYTDRIEPVSKERSIAIITQPFDPQKNRRHDKDRTQVCQELVKDSVKVLQEKFPRARVHIRNTDPTPLESFLRIVLAKEVMFCGPSSFCGIATLATMAEKGYIYHTSQHNWLRSVESYYSHLRVIDGPILAPLGKSADEMIDWMRNTQL